MGNSTGGACHCAKTPNSPQGSPKLDEHKEAWIDKETQLHTESQLHTETSPTALSQSQTEPQAESQVEQQQPHVESQVGQLERDAQEMGHADALQIQALRDEVNRSRAAKSAAAAAEASPLGSPAVGSPGNRMLLPPLHRSRSLPPALPGMMPHDQEQPRNSEEPAVHQELEQARGAAAEAAAVDQEETEMAASAPEAQLDVYETQAAEILDLYGDEDFIQEAEDSLMRNAAMPVPAETPAAVNTTNQLAATYPPPPDKATVRQVDADDGAAEQLAAWAADDLAKAASKAAEADATKAAEADTTKAAEGNASKDAGGASKAAKGDASKAAEEPGGKSKSKDSSEWDVLDTEAAILHSAQQALQRSLDVDGSDAWESIKSPKGAEGYTVQVLERSKTLFVVKIEGVMDAPPAAVVALLERAEGGPQTSKATVVRVVSPTCHLLHIEVKVPIIKNRDFVACQWVKREEGEPTTVVVRTSIPSTHAAELCAPNEKKFVRGRIVLQVGKNYY